MEKDSLSNKTIIFLLDAIREDYLLHMPFVSSLKRKHTYLTMIPSIGYSAGAHPSIWSGLHQNRHEQFLIFYFDPADNQFKKISSILRFIPKKIQPYILSALKLPYYRFSNIRRNPPQWYKSSIIDYPPGMPPEVARFIATKPKPPQHKETIFSILDRAGISWMTQTDMDNFYFRKTLPVDCTAFIRTDASVDFYYFYFADGLGHEKGPKSPEIIEYLKKTDACIKRLLKPDDAFMIFSDHGMVEIDDFINVQSYIKKLDLKIGRDYIAFYDATMVRFWAFNNRARMMLEESLADIPKTTLFTERLLKKYHLDFKGRKWFDILLLMEPGVRPFPDYFVPLQKAIKGYHGYWPEFRDSKGIFLSNMFTSKRQEMNLVDVLPTLLTAMGMKNAIPADIDGVSVMKR